MIIFLSVESFPELFFRLAALHIDYFVDLVVEVETEDGHIGLGNAALSPKPCKSVVDNYLKPAIIGESIWDYEHIWQKMYRQTLAWGRKGVGMTAISAVIFLVSANYDLAVSYILGRLENNDYGLAIVYSSALIVVMLFTIMLMQLIIGKRKLGRRDQNASILQGI